MLKPIFTEKSTNDAKNGKYSFYVAPSLNKNQIRVQIEDAFGVHVTSVRTINFKQSTRRTISGKFQTTSAKKKAIVTLAQKETIDLFEDKSKKKGKAKK